jgi:hypothetical protein
VVQVPPSPPRLLSHNFLVFPKVQIGPPHFALSRGDYVGPTIVPGALNATYLTSSPARQAPSIQTSKLRQRYVDITGFRLCGRDIGVWVLDAGDWYVWTAQLREE